MPARLIPDPYDELGSLYDEWVTSVVEDIPFYVAVANELARDLGRTPEIVELGAGSGRVTMPLARSGHRVRAVDVATQQLQRLEAEVHAARAGGTALDVEVVAADMRELGSAIAPDSADLVIAPFRCLLHVADEREPVLREAAAALRDGGLLAFDVFHPSPETVAETHDRWLLRERWHDDDRGGTWSVWERARFPEGRDTLELDVRCDFRSSALAAVNETSPAVEQREVRMRLRTPPPHAWQDALAAAGFSVEQVLGWFDGTPMDAHCEDSIWIARRTPRREPPRLP